MSAGKVILVGGALAGAMGVAAALICGRPHLNTGVDPDHGMRVVVTQPPERRVRFSQFAPIDTLPPSSVSVPPVAPAEPIRRDPPKNPPIPHELDGLY